MKNIQYGTEFIDQLKDKVHEQQWEIERLNKGKELLQCDLDNANSKLRDSIAIRLKAIEYIEKYITKQGETLPYYNYQKVIAILKGVDKE